MVMSSEQKVYSYKDVDINLSKEVQSENPIIVEGFPGIGLIGNIVSQYIVKELNAEYIGNINSMHFPPVAILEGGIITSPAKIYECTGKDLVILQSNVFVDIPASYYVGKAIVEWAQEINMREMLSIAGILTTTGENKVFGAATKKELLKRIEDNVKIFEVGTITDISGIVMAECSRKDLLGISLLGETSSPNPDPRAAVEVIKTINLLYGWDINVDKLIEEAERIELELQKFSDQMDKAKRVEGIPQRKEFPMYG